MERLYVLRAPERLTALHRLARRHLRTLREEAACLIADGLRRHARQAVCQRHAADQGEPGPERDDA